MKKYIANTVIALSITLKNGKSARVSFSSQTNGGSVFYTDDKDIQWALEHHYKFGKLFRLVYESKEVRQNVVPKKNIKQKKAPKNRAKEDKQSSKPTPAENDNIEEVPDITQEEEIEATAEEIETEEDESCELQVIEVSDPDSAKDYLAEKYDIVRTKLKTEESIQEAALAFGIVFKYI